MKYLIYCLFFTTLVFSQNYNYSITNNLATSTGVNNQLEEIEYFKAYLLPLAEKNNLQKALDTYGAVRLEKGDYSGGSDITLHSGQKLLGYPNFNKVPKIIIAAGSSNIKITNINSGSITFQAGNAITNSIFKNIESTSLLSVGGIIVSNSFINLSRCVLKWDMSSSGYFRNNKIIKHRIHSYYPQIVMKGNTTTPSYGNVQLWLNMLTPGGNGAEIDNLKTLTWVGLDAETWNYLNISAKPLIDMKNMGDVKIASIQGANFGPTPTPAFSISADNLFMTQKYIRNLGTDKSTLGKNTNMFLLDSNSEGYNIDVATTGYDFKGYFGTTNNITLGGANITSAITDIPTIEKLTKTILGTKNTPWAKPVFETIPNPTGDNWSVTRDSIKKEGKRDDTKYIQNLINTNGIAELQEGIYYISSTLTIKSNQGIIGKGTGKTAIVGLTDTFPLITGENESGEVRFYLSNMTLQGGSTGLRIHPLDGSRISVSPCLFKYLIFRNQNYGIHLDKFYGFDNNFIENVCFVDTNIGLFQEVDPSYIGGETSTMMFLDKVVFYKCQWINNKKAMSLLGKRACNLNAWIDCRFDNNDIVAEMNNYSSPLFANCNFTNTKGDFIIGGESGVGFYSCVFIRNTAKSTFQLYGVYLEGCSLLDNVKLCEKYKSKSFITNSIVTGTIGTMTSGMIVNSKMLSNPTFNKILVDVKGAIPTVIIDAAPQPYPQLLVTQ